MKRSIYMLLLVLAALNTGAIKAQAKYIDAKGTISFEASEALFEPVKAVNKSVTMLLDTSTGNIAALALMKGFRFKNSLMEEHFNENYIESETYPKATFKGTLLDFDISKLTESVSEVIVDGQLTLHGKGKAIRTPLTMHRTGDVIIVQGSFTVTPADFDIDIPKVVQNKIAKEIQVTMNFKLSEK